MLIDHTYFAQGTRQIRSASLGTVSPAGAITTPAEMEVCRFIDEYIAEYQEEYLKGMLGDETGNKVNAYLVCLDDDEDPKRMESFDEMCDHLKESFADYVFFHILRDINEQVTMTGIVRLKCANIYVSPIRRQVSVWNAMVDKHRAFKEWSKSGCIKAEFVTKINRFNL